MFDMGFLTAESEPREIKKKHSKENLLPMKYRVA